jgi:hypothetical protein
MARVKNYTLGAGKLFFDRLDADGNSTGEFYIGNTTSLTYSTDEERQEHYSSDEAARERDASVVTRSDVSVAFTTDDIQPENMAMMIKGEAETLTVAADLAVEENIAVVRRGRWYQIGVDATNPTGVRDLTVSSVTDDEAVPVAIPGGDGGANYELDLVLGRIFIKEDAPDVADGDIIIVTYDVGAHSRTIIVSTGDQITGALRYIADNTTGDNNDVFFPKIELSPDGDYEFKSDDWSEMSFSGEAVKSGTLAKVYVDGRPISA